MDLLCTKSATQLAELIRSKKVSSKEVVEAHLARIEEVNPQVNAVTLTLNESALIEAEKADQSSEEERNRPLHGVPFTIKENIDLMGTPTTAGIPSRKNVMPNHNAPIVDRMVAAGAIPIGRTNLPELGMRLDTDNPLRGRTFNPWDRTLTPGGSSGGEAAAIATGMSPFGLGNDIGGSVRNPAYCCGIASLKPTIGRVPHVPSIEPVDMGISGLFLSNGPMARSVNDLRIGLSVLSGRHPQDPQSLDVPLDGKIPEKPKVALVVEIEGYEIASSTRAEIKRAGRVLVDRGWVVEEVEAPEIKRVNEVWGKIINIGALDTELIKDIVKPETFAYFKQAGEIFDDPLLSLEEAIVERRRLRRLWSAFLTDYTVCIGPTWTNLPWPIDTDLDPKASMQALRKSFQFITPGNALGLPSVALPTGISDKLPTGIQIYADLFREDLCFLASEIIESESKCPTPIDPV